MDSRLGSQSATLSAVAAFVLIASGAGRAYGDSLEAPSQQDGGDASHQQSPSVDLGDADRAIESLMELYAARASSPGTQADGGSARVQSGAVAVPDRTNAEELKNVAAFVLKQSVDSATTKIKAEQDQQNAKQKEGEAKQAKASLDDLKAGKLLQYGISAGVALTVQAPWFSKGSADYTGLSSPGISAMPYLALFPGYWSSDSPTRAYCSTEYTDGGDAAQKASNHRAAEYLRSVIKSSESQDIRSLATDKKFDDDDYVLRKDIQRQAMVGNPAANGEGIYWDPTAPARGCRARDLGLYIGKPASFTVDTFLHELNQDGTLAAKSTKAKREVDPTVSFGFVYSANAYISVIGGAAVGTIDQKDITSNGQTIPGQGHVVWMVTSGIGGSVDLLGLLTK